METLLLKLTEADKESVLRQAAEIIKSGGLVVFPTETVYGLGASADDAGAVKKIFIAKGRPADNPIIVHVAAREQLLELVEHISPLEEKLMESFWPGPLTIIFQKKKNISNVVSGGLETIAVRMPAHLFARDLIKMAGVPIAAPSANISGRPSSTAGEHAFLDLEGKVDMIVDGGFSDGGLESTVVRAEEGKILILRPGAITKEMLEKVSSDVVFATEKKDLRASPGTRYKHYAPKARLEIFDSEDALRNRLEELQKKSTKVGVLPKRSLEEASKSLYRDLRDLDAQGAEVILCESFPEAGLGTALMDRLRKASGA